MDYDDFPDLVDGATPVTTGTAVNEAWWDLVQAALLGELRGATDPTRTSAQNIDEVLAARGAFASLLARLTDWEARQYVTPSAVRNGLVLGNLIGNGTFKQWSAGPSAAPDRWAKTGGGTVAKDAAIITGQDDFSALLTYAGSATTIRQKIVTSAMEARMAGLLNRIQSIPRDGSNAAWPGYGADDENLNFWLIGHVYTATGGVARLRIYDGADTKNSPYHDGNSALYPSKALIAGPLAWGGGEVIAECRVEGAGAANFELVGAILTPAGIPPMYLPEDWKPDAWTFPTIATPTVGTGYGYFIPQKPVQLIGLSAYAAGAVPTGGTTLKLDLMVPIGGSFVSCFTTLLAFTASDRHAYAAFDPAAADYRRLTVRPRLSSGASIADNSMARLDVNTRDSGNTGSNIVVTLHYLVQQLPLDVYRTPADLGEA